MEKPCAECGALFGPVVHNGKRRLARWTASLYCSRACWRVVVGREAQGSMRPDGYRNGKVRGNLEHREVMEAHLARRLRPSEVVHHRNGDKSDNRLENLQLFSSQSEHRKHHLETSGSIAASTKPELRPVV